MEYSFESLKNKVVLITGGSGAIGTAIAEGFQQLGANVHLWGHKGKSVQLSEDIAYAEVELEDKKQIEEEFETLERKFGAIDILVNCAGFTSGDPSEEYSYEKWKKTFAVNLDAPFILSQLVARNMIAHKHEGSIINITSIGAEYGFPGNPAYVTSKGGLKQLSKALAYDWARYGIRVNNVGPGYTKTKMTKGSWDDIEKRKQRSDRTLLKRWAEPEDMVGTVLFLASDLSKYITGQDIYVDGGWTTNGM